MPYEEIPDTGINRKSFLRAASVVGLGAATMVASPRSAMAATTTSPYGSLVTDYGATGDGTTNDTTAIQNCINAAGVGGSVFFPQGTYRAAGLAPLSGQTWSGPGVVKRLPSNSGSVVTGSDLADFRLNGLTFDGSRSDSTATDQSMIRLTRATRAVVRGCTFQNTPSTNAALELRGSIGSLVEVNTFTLVGYGVIVALALGQTDPCYGNVISGNYFQDIGLNAVFTTENVGSQSGSVVGRVKDTAIVGNTVVGWGDVAIETGSGCVRTLVSGNVCDNNGKGVSVASGILIRDNAGTVVSDNVVFGLPKTGTQKCISCVGLNGSSTDLTVTGNTVDGSAANGLFINGCTGLEITGGLVSNAGAEGILLDNVTQFAISGVRVVGSADHGISVGVYNTSAAKYGSITGCTILNNSAGSGLSNQRDGICVVGPNSTDLTITGNQVTDTRSTGKKQRYGINIFTPTANRYVVTGNNTNGNATKGVQDGGGTTKVVANNLA